MSIRQISATFAQARNWPVLSSLPPHKAAARGVVAPAPAGVGEGTHVVSLAIAQFRKDWPQIAARLDAMRAKAVAGEGL